MICNGHVILGVTGNLTGQSFKYEEALIVRQVMI